MMPVLLTDPRTSHRLEVRSTPIAEKYGAEAWTPPGPMNVGGGGPIVKPTDRVLPLLGGGASPQFEGRGV